MNKNIEDLKQEIAYKNFRMRRARQNDKLMKADDYATELIELKRKLVEISPATSLHDVKVKIEARVEFDYSLVYGDVTEMMLTSNVTMSMPVTEIYFDLKFFMIGYAHHVSGKGGIISGRNTEKGFTLMLGEVVELGSGDVVMPERYLI